MVDRWELALKARDEFYEDLRDSDDFISIAVEGTVERPVVHITVLGDESEQDPLPEIALGTRVVYTFLPREENFED